MPALNDEGGPEDFSKLIRGEITSDPANDLPLGVKLEFEAGLINTDLRERVSWIRQWQSFNGMLISMHFHSEDGYSVDGSAIVVAPGVALCATHVIEPYRQKLIMGNASCLCVGLAPDGMRIWRLMKFTSVPGTDLTIVGLSYASHLPATYSFYQATLSTRLPKVGERLAVCGFRARKFEITTDAGLACHGNILLCRGEVTRHYPGGRDAYLMPWPSLEVDCPAFGGMSGGPVYDERGFLVGLLCSSITDAHTGGPTFVSLLWPALGYPFRGGWPSGLLQEPISLLALDKVCQIERREACKVLCDTDENVGWAVEHWH